VNRFGGPLASRSERDTNHHYDQRSARGHRRTSRAPGLSQLAPQSLQSFALDRGARGPVHPGPAQYVAQQRAPLAPLRLRQSKALTIPRLWHLPARPPSPEVGALARLRPTARRSNHWVLNVVVRARSSPQVPGRRAQDILRQGSAFASGSQSSVSVPSRSLKGDQLVQSCARNGIRWRGCGISHA
jgi:hypothetical protein